MKTHWRQQQRFGLELSVAEEAEQAQQDNEEVDFSDGREPGDYDTKYPPTAWRQITAEAVYLLLLSLVCAGHAVALVADASSVVRFYLGLIGIAPPGSFQIEAVRLWLVVFFSGILGANVFALKWLYHTVGWGIWNRDRIVWRVFVPLQGGLLAVFTGCMILAGIIPLLNAGMFSRCVTAAGYGFFVGLFADNFVAALQKLANSLLGTLGRSTS